MPSRRVLIAGEGDAFDISFIDPVLIALACSSEGDDCTVVDDVADLVVEIGEICVSPLATWLW